MTEKINSGPAGVLIKRPGQDWWISSPIAIPLLDGAKLPIIYVDLVPERDPTFIAAADQALNSFLAMTLADRDTLSESVYKNCQDTIHSLGGDYIPEEILNLHNAQDIWRYVEPTELCLTRGNDNDDIYLQLLCECGWEQEHGLQLVFHEGYRLVRVSQQDGYLTDEEAGED
ncbi:MAG: hypothetical protein JST90_06330 [Bacteroidetes bacterium]|nr:hypothetical protein [Bacteroidota bacterium]